MRRHARGLTNFWHAPLSVFPDVLYNPFINTQTVPWVGEAQPTTPDAFANWWVALRQPTLQGLDKSIMAKSVGKDKKGKGEDDSFKIVARNRRARFEFDLLDSTEAGIVLTGTEVKSLRNGKASLEESYAGIDNGEVWLYGCDIPEYVQANRMNHKPKRPRKLLLHRSEIGKLIAKASEKGLTIVPLKIYFKDGMAKVEICVAKGRKLYDKREALKKKDAKRDIDRVIRGRG